MASFSNNTTMKVNAAVSALHTGTGTTLYTAPANAYARVKLYAIINGASGSLSAAVAGRQVFVVTWSGSVVTNVLGGAYDGTGSVTQAVSNEIIVGPGQALTCSGPAGCQYQLSGVDFLNTP